MTNSTSSANLLSSLLLKTKLAKNDILQEKARRSLLGFTEFTFTDYQTNWHHRAVARVLDKWIAGEIANLMIFMPPRHGKSELVSRRLPAYILGKHPKDTVVFASYSATLASKMNRDVQRVIDNKKYYELFPDTVLPDSSHKSVLGARNRNWVRNNTMFEVVQHGGSYICAGVGGPLTGMGGRWGIIDDPIKNMQEAMSETVRDSVWEWYQSVFDSRLEGDSPRKLITLTRWHPDDLAGRLLELAEKDPQADQWHVLRLPAICNDIERPYEERSHGEALWPEKKSKNALTRIEHTVTPKIWSALYQQEPTPQEGNMWKEGYIKPISRDDLEQIPLQSVGCDWDMAYTERESNSASAYVQAGKWNNNMYITDIGWDWMEFPELVQWVKSKEDPHYVEDAASGKSAVQALRRQGVTALKVPVEGDKIARTNMILPDGAAGKIYIAEDLYDKLMFDKKQGIVHLSPDNPDIDLNDALVQSATRLLHGGKLNWDTLFEDDDLMRGGLNA